MGHSLKLAFPAIALFCCSPAISQVVIAGEGHAKDGDSLMVGVTEVRLYGIDAPEFRQSCDRGGQSWGCGREAAEKLAEMVDGKRVDCTQVGTDQYQRALARCRVGETDINRTLVALGYAVAFRRYSLDYASAEESAKVNRRGIWSGTFEMPSEYRHLGVKALAAEREPRWNGRTPVRIASTQSNNECRIKGNRNRKGQWIYHLPGMPYYDATRAEEIFCTEAQARAAGYRRAIVR